MRIEDISGLTVTVLRGGEAWGGSSSVQSNGQRGAQGSEQLQQRIVIGMIVDGCSSQACASRVVGMVG